MKAKPDSILSADPRNLISRRAALASTAAVAALAMPAGALAAEPSRLAELWADYLAAGNEAEATNDAGAWARWRQLGAELENAEPAGLADVVAQLRLLAAELDGSHMTATSRLTRIADRLAAFAGVTVPAAPSVLADGEEVA